LVPGFTQLDRIDKEIKRTHLRNSNPFLAWIDRPPRIDTFAAYLFVPTKKRRMTHVLEVEIGSKRIPQDTDRLAMALEKLGSLTIGHQPPHAVPHWILFRLPKPAHLALYMIIAQLATTRRSFFPLLLHSIITNPEGRSHTHEGHDSQGPIHSVRSSRSSSLPLLMEQSFNFIPRRRLIRLTSPDGVSNSIYRLTGRAARHYTVYSGSQLKEMVCKH